MSAMNIVPATVSYPFEKKGLPSGPYIPGAADVTVLDWAAGTPVINYSSAGKVGIAALDGASIVTDANDLVGLTVEAFDGGYFTAAINGLHHTKVVTDLLFPGVAIEANIYYDGDDDADDTIAQADLFSAVVMKKLASGIFVFDKQTTPSAMATFTIVDFVDPVGTIYGRVLAVAAPAYLAFP